MNKITIELGSVENTCFVAMPFHPLFKTEYEKIICPALEELNIKCIRGDEIYTKQQIMDDIWSSIRQCRFVLAELTTKNPNVLYEIGLAHAIGKPVIIITRNADDVPFDLTALRYLFYDVNDPFWGNNLKSGIQNLVKKVLANPEIENYLEDIESHGVKYPELTREKVKTRKSTQKIHDISGSWKGEYTGLEDVPHSIFLEIIQNENELSGSALVDYGKNKLYTVVHQLMNGTIDKDKVDFYCVNYTFVKRGDTTDYASDNFKLTYVPEEKMLQGYINSNLRLEPDFKQKISFRKVDGEELA